MSSRILYSLTDDKDKDGGGVHKQKQKQKQKHIGCINGIFQLFDRSHFLPGGSRLAGSGRKRLTTEGKTAKERHGLSTDSSRSSVSSSCNSSSFSSTENRAKDLPRLQQCRHSNNLQKSAYVDSPRPVLPSNVARESLRDLRSLNFVDSPRFSYDGWESKDEIKSQPRYSLDSKRSSLSLLSLKVQQLQEDQDPGRHKHKWQSTVVAKLMGLEADTSNVQASSRSPRGHGRNSSVDALDLFSVSSRNESPLQSPAFSVYGELEKRLEQIEFKRSGKDLRALKQILEAMQRSQQSQEDRNKIRRAITERNNSSDSEFTAKFSDHNSTIGFVREQIPRSFHRIQGNSSDHQRTDGLTPRGSPRQAHFMSTSAVSTCRAEGRRQLAEGNIPGRNFGDSSTRPLRKKKLDLIYYGNRSYHPGRQLRQVQSSCEAPKSKARGGLGGSCSRNRISKSSDDACRDEDIEVTGVAKSEQPAKKLLSQSKLKEESLSEFGTTLAEPSPSPVSVLDSSYMEDELPSPVKMSSEAFEDDEAHGYHGKGRGLHAAGDLFPREKHCKSLKKPQIDRLQMLSSSKLLGNPDADNLTRIRHHPSGAIMTNLFTTLGHDKLRDNLLPDQPRFKHRERIQRELLFDVIDEILVQKLTPDNHGNRFLPHSLAAKKTGQEQLLKGLRSEIAHLQADNSKCVIIHDNEDNGFIQTILRRDLLHESQNWKVCYDDSGIVLDIERLIFKDLVTEVVTGATAGLRNSLTSSVREMTLK